jgi:uncharacterized protein YdiU (UPF0061 family)
MTTSTPTGTLLDELRFDNRFVDELPADSSDAITSRQVTGAAYSRVLPSPTSGPRLVAYSPEMATELGIDASAIATAAFAEVFSGNRLLDGMDPFAMAYGGHQFGHWAGQLGDGRAIALGEAIAVDGSRQTLQLKGAGQTPFSRRADGLAVLRSSIREFLCSEAMHALGVPTTRALSLVLTGDSVMRDMFYDGNAAYEPGAIVTRVAPSFVRFGTFQLPAARGDEALLRSLVDFTIRNDFPELGPPGPATYLDWFREVVRRTAVMIAHWMRVGFVHGVMNTDNMSILGLTIDYGPYGWVDDYDPDWTPNTTDFQHRRYRFGNQPGIAHWNLMQLANALLPITDDTATMQAALDEYAAVFDREWRSMMASKIGLPELGAEDGDLVRDMLGMLGATETDMTIFFRNLADVPVVAGVGDDDLIAPLTAAYYKPEEVEGDTRRRILEWLRAYGARVRDAGVDEEQRRLRMHGVNPKYVLRNYMAQTAIDAAGEEGDFSLISELLDVLRNPYDEQPGREHYAAKRPEWARHRPGCSTLSCSS